MLERRDVVVEERELGVGDRDAIVVVVECELEELRDVDVVDDGQGLKQLISYTM